MHGTIVSASFFAPWNKKVEPYIKIATGDYPKLKKERGRDSALAAFLHSLAHELIHYQQWVATNKLSEYGVVRRASTIVNKYSRTVDRP